MTYEQENRQTIIDYLEQGCKGNAMGSVGVEMEHFILDEDRDAVPYEEKHGRLGMKDILEAISQYYSEVSRTEEGNIMGCARQLSNLTIEPASQLEISISPLSSISEVADEYRNFMFRLKQIIEPHGYVVEPAGYHPTAKAETLPLIPKPRYHFMDEYFAQLPGMHAERMMRATTSLQVSLDFADEADAVRKMRLATLLGPIFSFICDNCPTFEGEPNSSALVRMHVWREVDPARCGVAPGLFDEDFGFEKYADWLLSTPPIFITRGGDHSTGTLTAAQAYADAPMTNEDIEHLLSMFWPDVRLKRYVEIRQADALPIGPALGYVALIKGLFYSDINLALLEDKLGVGEDGSYPYTEQDVEDAIDAITADEFQAVVYGHTVNDWVDTLFRLAPDGLGTEAHFLEELQDFMGF